jgi:2-methylcitrate dehydratase PrpD
VRQGRPGSSSPLRRSHLARRSGSRCGKQRAAEAGTIAADLAALGWTAADDILEAPRGFFQAAGGGFDPHATSRRRTSTRSISAPTTP